MVVRVPHVFSCQHEFVAFPAYFICSKCEHVRKELPFSRDNRKSLLFFPIPVPVPAKEAKAG